MAGELFTQPWLQLDRPSGLRPEKPDALLLTSNAVCPK